MFYKYGTDLEKSVFGSQSSGRKLVKKFRRRDVNFADAVRSIIKKSSSVCPKTKIGYSIYGKIRDQLLKNNIDPVGLQFISTIGTIVDAHYMVDGLVYLPSLDPYVVTIDAFNIRPSRLRVLHSLWLDTFPGEVYTQADFQTDLYLYKEGLWEWREAVQRREKSHEREHSISDLKSDLCADNDGSFEWQREAGFIKKISIEMEVDIRTYAVSQRPEDLFILTPYDVSVGIGSFAKLIAGYFMKVSGTKKTAQVSH